MASIRDQNKEAIVVSSVSQARNMFASSSGKATVTASDSMTARKSKVANFVSPSGSYGYGFGGIGGGGAGGFADSVLGTATNIYSPHLSTDFLELPQNLAEMRSYYRHFYNSDPYVNRAINLHTELPLSKLRLSLPKGKDAKRNRQILKFFTDMVDRIDLLGALIDATREYYVIGEAFLFAEDHDPEPPESLYTTEERHINSATGEVTVRKVEAANADEIKKDFYEEHYKGWERVILLPPDQVQIDTYQFTHEYTVELIPDEKTKGLVRAASMQDESALRALASVPDEIIEYIQQDRNLPLGTDPYEGSFVFQLARNKPTGRDHGVSILSPCMQTLVYRDKLRQAQTSIASRAMTPKRLVYAEDMSQADVEELRTQVDLMLLDPDYSLVTNFQVNWEEISARDRLLDLNSEYDITDRQLFAGLATTESMLTGESSYSGERINIEIINTRYMLYRERLQQYVENYLFKPVAEKKGFYEYDEFGNKVLLYPELSFTRLALRDNRDTFDAMFNLYQKGSLSVGYILELFNLDPVAVEERLRQDFMTMNDSLFNEILRGAYNEAGRFLPEQSDMIERIVDYLKLTYRPPRDENSRFSHVKGADAEGDGLKSSDLVADVFRDLIERSESDALVAALADLIQEKPQIARKLSKLIAERKND